MPDPDPETPSADETSDPMPFPDIPLPNPPISGPDDPGPVAA